MDTINLVFQAVCGVWFVSEVILSTFFRSKSSDPQKDKHSLRYIWMSISLAVPLAIFISKASNFPISSWGHFIYVGLGVILSGAALRWTAIWQLGKFFTTNLAFDNTQTLVDKGLYGLIRHPSYTGSLLSFFGFGLALNNWVSLAVVFSLVAAAFLYRIQLEEKMMMEEMGQDYADYQARTKKLIPFVY